MENNNRFYIVERGDNFRIKGTLLKYEPYTQDIHIGFITKFFIKKNCFVENETGFLDIRDFENDNLLFTVWLNSEDNYPCSDKKLKIKLDEYIELVSLIEFTVKNKLTSKDKELINNLLLKYNFRIYSEDKRRFLDKGVEDIAMTTSSQGRNWTV